MHACTHSEPKHAQNFQMSLVAILKSFLTENEKMDATLKKDIDKTQLFDVGEHAHARTHARTASLNVHAIFLCLWWPF